MVHVPEFTATATSIALLAAETKVFRFVLDAPFQKSFTFRAGQFVSLKIEEKVFRAYSIASAPMLLPEFELCVKIIPEGKGSTYLDNLAVGDQITFRGAFGNFCIARAEKDKFFVAGGTGIAPMKAFFEEINVQNICGNHELIFGVRAEEYAVYHDEFAAAGAQRDDFQFSLCISGDTSENFQGFCGNPAQFVEAKPVEYFTNKDVYICGPPAMVKAVTQILTEEKNFPKDQIFTEAY